MRNLLILGAILVAVAGCTDAPGTTQDPLAQTAQTGNIPASLCGYTTPAYANDMLWALRAARSQAKYCGEQYFPALAQPQLSFNCQLASAAQRHNNDMDVNNFFAHQGSDFSTLGTRVSDTGYPYVWVAENLAGGRDNAHETVRQWIDSPGHCANIMSSQATEFGIAYSNGSIGNMQHIWTLVLGDR